MLNSAILIKVKERLNKLSSSDYDNIESWQIVEAFNKGQVDWCRRNLHGMNTMKEGDEQSTRRVDDLEILLTPLTVLGTDRKTYYELTKPADYLQWKRVFTDAISSCCKDPRRMVIYLAEEGNLDLLLRDKNKKPSFEWAETFCTQSTGKVQIYTNGEFELVNSGLMYYRQPRKIEIANIVDPYTGNTPTIDVTSEFKDDLVELFVDECVKILAGDIEAGNQVQRETQAVENNN
jgi:hypothetical protein